MRRLIVRYGPCPGKTADAKGVLHADFTGTLVFDRPLAASPEGPDSFLTFVRAVWDAAVCEGHGHILIGCYEKLAALDPATGKPAAPCAVRLCGFEAQNLAKKAAAGPVGYQLLFSVSRAHAPGGGPPHVDLAVDYRGPGGPQVRVLAPVLGQKGRLALGALDAALDLTKDDVLMLDRA